jgi:sugar/nucleoside kinase (ribokinase family)
LLKYVDVFLPNTREATRITGTGDMETAVKQLAEMVPLVVAKLGTEGALAQRGAERFVSPALRITAVDPVGAGDSFDAGFCTNICEDPISQPAWPVATAPVLYPSLAREEQKPSATRNIANVSCASTDGVGRTPPPSGSLPAADDP